MTFSRDSSPTCSRHILDHLMTQLRILLAAGLLLLGFACSRRDANVLRIGVSPVPHGEILEQIVAPLRAQGISIQMVNFNDYIQPNMALASGDLAANFYQHIPYLEQFNRDRVRKEFGVSILLITHELTAVRAICDRVAVLDAGRVVEEETVEQLLTRPVSAPAKRLLAGQIQGAANFA